MLKISLETSSVYTSFSLIILQGFPKAIELLGMFLFTKEFAPIITLSPIFTSGKIVLFAPIQTWLPMVMGFAFVCLRKLFKL